MSISSVLEGDADGARVLGRAAVIAPDTEGEDVALLGRAGVDDLSRVSPAVSKRVNTTSKHGRLILPDVFRIGGIMLLHSYKKWMI